MTQIPSWGDSGHRQSRQTSRQEAIARHADHAKNRSRSQKDWTTAPSKSVETTLRPAHTNRAVRMLGFCPCGDRLRTLAGRSQGRRNPWAFLGAAVIFFTVKSNLWHQFRFRLVFGCDDGQGDFMLPCHPEGATPMGRPGSSGSKYDFSQLIPRGLDDREKGIVIHVYFKNEVFRGNR